MTTRVGDANLGEDPRLERSFAAPGVGASFSAGDWEQTNHLLVVIIVKR